MPRRMELQEDGLLEDEALYETEGSLGWAGEDVGSVGECRVYII